MVYLRQIFFRKQLKLIDIRFLLKLLNTNLTLKQALQLIKNKENKNIINQILNDLQKGVTIEVIFTKLIPKSFNNYFKSLIKTLSFNKALALSLSFYESENQRKNKLIKQITYPIMLMAIVLIGLFIFDRFGFDLIIDLLLGFKVDVSFILIFRKVFNILIKVLLTLMFLFIIGIWYFKKGNNYLMLYAFICENKLFNSIKQLACLNMLNLYVACYKMGFNTKQIMSILKSLVNKPLIAFLAHKLENALLEGQSFKNSFDNKYFDEALKSFINVASYTNDFEKIMNEYIEITSNSIDEKIKKITTSLQLIIYAMIGFLIIFVYKLLFAPMSALQEL